MIKSIFYEYRMPARSAGIAFQHFYIASLLCAYSVFIDSKHPLISIFIPGNVDITSSYCVMVYSYVKIGIIINMVNIFDVVV